MKIMTVAPVLFLILAAVAAQAENPLEFAARLEQAGMNVEAMNAYHAAIPELTGDRAVLVHHKLADLYEQNGDTAGREAELIRFEQLAAGSTSPAVMRVLDRVRERLDADREIAARAFAERTDGLLRSGSADPAIIREEAGKVREQVEVLVQYRSGAVERYQALKDRSPLHAREFAARRLRLAQALYYASFLKAADSEEHRAALQELYIQYGADNREPATLEHSFLSGRILESLERYSDAARVFMGCVDHADIPANRPLRKAAFSSAVAGFFKAGDYIGCLTAGLSYMHEYPVTPVTMTEQDQVTSNYLVQSINALQTQGNELALRRIVQGGRSYAVLDVKAKRAGLDTMRTYEVQGSGGSRARIEMPGITVAGSTGTVAVPTN